jgi:hypothetical protein
LSLSARVGDTQEFVLSLKEERRDCPENMATLDLVSLLAPTVRTRVSDRAILLEMVPR